MIQAFYMDRCHFCPSPESSKVICRSIQRKVKDFFSFFTCSMSVYDLHLDVFAEGHDPHWSQLNAVVKDVATDPYYVFGYYERKERSGRAQQRKKKGVQQPASKGISRKDLERYTEIYKVLGGETD